MGGPGEKESLGLWLWGLLKGSWDLVSEVMSRVISQITPLRGLITPIMAYLLSPMTL